LEFNEITLGEILVPRIDMVAFDIEYSFEKLLTLAENSSYSRIPVYDEKIDNIIGVLALNHFYRALVDANGEEFDIRPLLLEPCFLHKSMKLPQALKTMRENQIHLAIVVDEYGGTLGIVTLEDILEQIVGDIWDESDEIVEEYHQISDVSYEISGDMGIWDFFDLLEINARDFESEYTTVGGWAIEMLNAQPNEGDSFHYKNLYIIVAEMEDLRILRLTVLVNPPEEDEDEEA
jgi:CBS domain containing-hemolysin-like protein